MRCFVSIALAAALAGCSDQREVLPHVEFIGGGFIFNYRVGQADYGFIVKPRRIIAAGTVLEARFENPSGGEPLVVRQPARFGRLQYVFRSPPVRGVEAGRDYRVELRLLDPETGKPYASYARTFRSDVAQGILPDRPPVVGPGYQPAPPS